MRRGSAYPWPGRQLHRRGPGEELASLSLPNPTAPHEDRAAAWRPPKVGIRHKSRSHVCHRVARKGADGEPVVGRAPGPAGQEGAVGRPSRTPPPPSPCEPALVGGAYAGQNPPILVGFALC